MELQGSEISRGRWEISREFEQDEEVLTLSCTSSLAWIAEHKGCLKTNVRKSTRATNRCLARNEKLDIFSSISMNVSRCFFLMFICQEAGQMWDDLLLLLSKTSTVISVNLLKPVFWPEEPHICMLTPIESVHIYGRFTWNGRTQII